MMRTIFYCAVLVPSIVVAYPPPEKPAPSAPKPILATLIIRRVPPLDSQSPMAVFHEAATELEFRLKSYASGTDSEAVLFDSIERVLPLNRFAHSLEAQIDALTDLSKIAEEVRKVMKARTLDENLGAARTKADYHRARGICLRVNEELHRLEWVLHGTKPLIEQMDKTKYPKLIPVP